MTTLGCGNPTIGGRKVQVHGDHDAVHPDCTRPVKDGDVIEIDDAINDSVYWQTKDGRMQKLGARHVTLPGSPLASSAAADGRPVITVSWPGLDRLRASHAALLTACRDTRYMLGRGQPMDGDGLRLSRDWAAGMGEVLAWVIAEAERAERGD